MSKKHITIGIVLLLIALKIAMPVSAAEISNGHYSTQTYPGSWYQNGSDWYWLGNNGVYLKSAYLDYLECTYFLKSTGLMSTGWEQIDGSWYYFHNWGGMYKNTFFEYLNNTYYVDENGVMATGWKQIDGNWYYFHSWGGMYRNCFFEYSDQTYYVDSEGVMATGWKQVDGVWHYFHTWGGMYRNSFILYDNNYYYLDSNGNMKTGWNNIDGDWYYFKSWGGGAKGWNRLTRNGKNSNNPYWNYFSEAGKLITDSDSEGCQEGYNTWQDHKNATLLTGSTIKYSISSRHMYSNQIVSALNQWASNTGKSFTNNASDYNLLFTTGSMEDNVNARTYFYYGTFQYAANQQKRNWDFVIISSNLTKTNLQSATFAHEVGHAFGLSHRITNQSSIMCSPKWGRTVSTIQSCDVVTYNHLYS